MIGEKSLFLTMSAVSSSFWSALLHALREERDFALVEPVPYPTKARSHANHYDGDLLHTIAISGLSHVRTELLRWTLLSEPARDSSRFAYPG